MNELEKKESALSLREQELKKELDTIFDKSLSKAKVVGIVAVLGGIFALVVLRGLRPPIKRNKKGSLFGKIIMPFIYSYALELALKHIVKRLKKFKHS